MQPLPSLRRSRRAFSLIEIVVIIIIVALMLLIIIPHIFSGQKLHKAERVKEDLVALNGAIEHYALDNGKVSGSPVTYADLSKYIDPHTDVSRLHGHDVFGDSYGPFTVGEPPAVPKKTEDRLFGVVSQDYWAPYLPVVAPATAGN